MVMPPRVAPASPTPPPRWQGSWLPAADLALDEERAATVSFDRRGRCRLTLAVDRPDEAHAKEALDWVKAAWDGSKDTRKKLKDMK